MNTEKNEFVQKLALWRHQKYGWLTAFEWFVGGDEPVHEEYVRMTEWQEIEFKPLPAEETARTQMAALTRLREQTVAEFSEKLSFIDGRIANLRALTGPQS